MKDGENHRKDRFPGKARPPSQSLGEPKVYPDGQQVDIPVLEYVVMGAVRLTKADDWKSLSKQWCDIVKSLALPL